jgi:dihydroorotase (multifunctional complex type)
VSRLVSDDRGADIDLVVRNGTVITPQAQVRGDVVIQRGRVLDIVGGWSGPARASIDATGLLVYPGMIDTHVHLMEPGDPSRETFAEGTAAAARSGVTTIIEHTHGWPVNELARLREKRDHLSGRAHVDYGLAAHVWPDRLAEIEPLWHAGVGFFKIFTCTTHGVPGLGADRLLHVFGRLAGLNARCLVHCEDELITAAAERLLKADNRLDPGVLTEWRSREAELVAVSQVAAAASLTGAVVRVAHASNPTVAALIAKARASGAALSAETCPQYLVLHEDEVLTEGALRKFTPPARIRTEADRAAMWDLVARGELDTIASDHAPSTREQKSTGDIWSVPFGLPGLDTTFAVLLDAVSAGAITAQQVAEVYSNRPATHFGLAGKGRIAPGYDADLALVDPDEVWTVDDADVLSHAGWSPFAGRRLRGRAVLTMLRGEVVCEDGVVSPERVGRFVPGLGARVAAASAR